MRRTMIVFVMLTLVFGLAVAFAGDHAYTGAKKCKMCHQKENGGMIYEKWEESAHAGAFETLGSDVAKEAYAALGKEGNPQEDAECLGCHTTGDSVENFAEGVSCEACHGAGGDYWKKSVMVDHEAAVAAGMVGNPKEGCINCHNEKSPTFKEFNFDEKYPMIEHSVPAE